VFTRILPPASTILLCAAIAGCQQGADRERAAPAPRITIEALAPRGDVALPITFEWKATTAGPDPLYRVTVYDGVERPLFEHETRVPRFQPPPDRQPLFSSTRRFLWRVAVVDGAGNVMAQTPLVECTVR
jgi:hypothetical protein